MTAAQVLLDADTCPDCVKRRGLCGKESCRRPVLPQLAQNVGWLKLIGNALTEQTKRQKPAPAKEKAAIARIGRRNARKLARSGRGAFALALAIANR